MTDISGPHGATPEQWAHFSKHLNRTEDLLPVVSDPKATISPKSKMRDLGKTPSRFDGQREVVGIPQWTVAHTSDNQVNLWKREPDYGIALQTRYFRAIDIDVPDPAKSRQIADLVEMVVGCLPTRGRSNSGKLLLLFEMQGEFNKRIIRTEDGIIEFLATGQQCIVAGRHPSGVMYEWIDGLPDVVPVITPAEFEALWSGLKDTYAIDSAEFTTGVRPSIPRTDEHMHDDPVVVFMAENNWVVEYDRDGRVHVRCPWEDQHTSDSGPSSTSYFPRGVGGFDTGGFKCLHAHCAAQNVGHFTKAIGFDRDLFEDVSYKADASGFEDCSEPAAPGLMVAAPPVAGDKPFDSDEPWPTLIRDKKGICNTADNVLKACSRPDMVKMRVAYDQFKDLTMIVHEGEETWRPIKDTDYIRVRAQLERRGFVSVGSEIVREALMRVAEVNAFDSAIQWGNSLVWDGNCRVDGFFHTYFGCVDTPYTRAVSRYMWSAMAGRCIKTGVKADMVPVLVGKQGTGKTSAVEALVPEEGSFVELNLEVRDDNLARSLRGKLVAELAELRGLRGRDSEAIKAWFSRRKEEWIPKFKEYGTTFWRRFITIGTTNEEEFLDDTTGERRWLPIKVAREQDVEGIRRDREQLWAEAVVIFQMEGVCWQDAQRLAGAEHAAFKVTDDWDEAVAHWLLQDGMDEQVGVARGQGVVKTKDVLIGALGFDIKGVSKREEIRVAKILSRLGYIKVDTRQDGAKLKGWKAGAACTQNFARS